MKKMKTLKMETLKLKTLKLKDVIDTSMDVTEMGHLIAGESDSMPEYGCIVGICMHNLHAGPDFCEANPCAVSVQ